MESDNHVTKEYTPTRREQPADQVPPLFDVRDLARRYKTSVRHIYRLANAGQLPWGTKLGALRRWSRASIEEWEAGGCKPVRS